MSLVTKLTEDMKAALKARDSGRLQTVRMLLSEAQLKSKELKRDLTDAEEIAYLASAAKRRRESIDAYVGAGREDLAQQEREELVVIETYLPKPLTDEEVDTLIRDAIAATGATGPSDMGRIMGAISGALKGRYDGAAARTRVVAALGG
ncbi:MAG: GatB/YqeY domain-containing protein [Myxococcales bacterium]|nr:GatB/YqeY domain-containing protein [Myxococcales bacterium]